MRFNPQGSIREAEEVEYMCPNIGVLNDSTPPPAAPSNLVVRPSSLFTWNGVEGITEYQIESSSNNVAYSVFVTTTITGPVVQDQPLSLNTSKTSPVSLTGTWWRIRSKQGEAVSDPSAPFFLGGEAPPPTP